MIPGRRAAALAGAALFFCAFVALGTWQLERRVWKLALIERVQERVHAPPVPAPPPAEWPRVDRPHDEYRHVGASGVFLDDAETLVQATTELGAGYWVLTPLRLGDGSTLSVNRGFVAPEERGLAAHGAAPAGLTAVNGLLRLTEPEGAWLRRNDPAANRWYSRDVQAIARARHLRNVAPYFIDADARPDARSDAAAARAPVGGLTVISFYNNHLVYAITWYTLALMIPLGLWLGIRERPST